MSKALLIPKEIASENIELFQSEDSRAVAAFKRALQSAYPTIELDAIFAILFPTDLLTALPGSSALSAEKMKLAFEWLNDFSQTKKQDFCNASQEAIMEREEDPLIKDNKNGAGSKEIFKADHEKPSEKRDLITEEKEPCFGMNRPSIAEEKAIRQTYNQIVFVTSPLFSQLNLTEHELIQDIEVFFNRAVMEDTSTTWKEAASKAYEKSNGLHELLLRHIPSMERESEYERIFFQKERLYQKAILAEIRAEASKKEALDYNQTDTKRLISFAQEKVQPALELAIDRVLNPKNVNKNEKVCVRKLI